MDKNFHDNTFYVTSSRLYRYAKEKGLPINLSCWNLEDDNIENLDLTNLGLEIDLRKLYAPSHGKMRISKDTGILLTRPPYGDNFIDLRNTRLSGNRIYGNLKMRQVISIDDEVEECFYLYNEKTFDKSYKKLYPEFFLEEEADPFIKDKYYNPLVMIRNNPETDTKERIMIRQKLTFDEYIKYYKDLHEKYLGNFNFSKKDYALIMLCENIGLKRTKELLHSINDIGLPFEVFIDGIATRRNRDLWYYFGNVNTHNEEVEKYCQAIDNIKKR